jgi:hypothetical protein
MKIIILALLILITLIFLGWLGLKIQPKPFPTLSYEASLLQTIPLPGGLPAPVARFYHQVYGDQIPVIETAVISGRASMRVNGITFPARFRFTHLAGQGYRHYIEATFFGLPIMKVNERYLDGHARLELPFGVFESTQVDQAANLGLWAESMWLSSVFISDPRVRWESVDEETAILVTPFDDGEQRFIVRFDQQTGLLLLMEAMRYRDAEGDSKILWLSEARSWKTINGTLIPSTGAAIWLDEGTPWAVFTVEELAYNLNVTEYIRSTGP